MHQSWAIKKEEINRRKQGVKCSVIAIGDFDYKLADP